MERKLKELQDRYDLCEKYLESIDVTSGPQQLIRALRLAIAQRNEWLRRVVIDSYQSEVDRQNEEIKKLLKNC